MEPTGRELQIEDLLIRGYSQEKIAAILGCSKSTVSVHAVSLYKKREVHSQIELLLAWLERNEIFAFPAESEERKTDAA